LPLLKDSWHRRRYFITNADYVIIKEFYDSKVIKNPWFKGADYKSAPAAYLIYWSFPSVEI